MCILNFKELLFLTDEAQNALNNEINGIPNLWKEYQYAAKNNNQDYIVKGKNWNEINQTKGGIYIWGFWIEVDLVRFFIPLYVGLRKTNCILRVIHEHLSPNGQESAFGVKSLFKVPKVKSDIIALYQCIERYNKYLIGATVKTVNKRMIDFFTFPDSISNWLLFFHNRAFYVNKLVGCTTHNINGYHNIYSQDQSKSMRQLTSRPNCIPASCHAVEMANARNYLAKHFCFTYAELPMDISNTISIEKCESATKRKLIDEYNIWTFSKPKEPKLAEGLTINFYFNSVPLGAQLPCMNNREKLRTNLKDHSGLLPTY